MRRSARTPSTSPTSAPEFIARLREARSRDGREVTDEDKHHIHEAIDRLFDLQKYPFMVLELASSVSEEQVADVFVRINSKGTPLNQADFILTLMSVFWDDGRRELEAFCREARQPSVAGPSPYNHFLTPDPDHLLRVSVARGFKRARLQHVYSLLRGKDLETGRFSDERRDAQFALLKDSQSQTLSLQNRHDFTKVPLEAGFRSAAMLSSRTALLYAYAHYLIGHLDHGVERHRLRSLMARWLFFTQLTGRYTSSPESIMEQDLGRLADVSDAAAFEAHLQAIIDQTLSEDFWSIALPNELATSAGRNPALSPTGRR